MHVIVYYSSIISNAVKNLRNVEKCVNGQLHDYNSSSICVKRKGLRHSRKWEASLSLSLSLLVTNRMSPSTSEISEDLCEIMRCPNKSVTKTPKHQTYCRTLAHASHSFQTESMAPVTFTWICHGPVMDLSWTCPLPGGNWKWHLYTPLWHNKAITFR